MMNSGKITKEEILARIDICPFKDGSCCGRYDGCKIPCDGACSWVVDYARLLELENRIGGKVEMEPELKFATRFKFRGKAIDGGDWVYGRNIQNQIDGTGRVCIDEKCNQRWLVPETVGQYIGLNDKNGKEIYEGDILECTASNQSSEIMGVEWDNRFESAAFRVVDSDGYWDDFHNYASFEVIGNIYDNPELFKTNDNNCV